MVSVELPSEYEKESWQLSEQEKFNVVMENRELGNTLYRDGKIDEAEEKYRAALAIIEQLLLKYDHISHFVNLFMKFIVST